MKKCEFSERVLWCLYHYQGFRRVAEKTVEDAIEAMNDPCAPKRDIAGTPYVTVSDNTNMWTHLDCVYCDDELFLC